MTKKESFEAIVDILNDNGFTDLAKVMNHEIDLVVKKNAYKSSKPTKTQKANEVLKDAIADVLDATPADIPTIIGKNSDFPNSIQKMSSMLGQLVDEGRAVRTIVKRKAYFSAV
jgi:hypothetical protein